MRSEKKVFLERCLQNSQDKACDSILIKLHSYGCKKETLEQVFSWSMLNRVLGVLACFACLRACVLRCLAHLRAYVLGVLTCLRACVLGVLVCVRACLL